MPLRPSEKLKTAIGGSLVAVWLLWFFVLSKPSPPFDETPHRALGHVLAEEALKLATPDSKIIVIVRDTKTFRSPAIDTQMRVFRKVLAGKGKSIADTQLITVDALRVQTVPPGDFLQILRSSGDNDVVVSFTGPPALTEAQLAKLGRKHPKVIAVCTGAVARQVDLDQVFSRGLLHQAVLDRPDAGKPANVPPDERSIFEHFFRLASPGSLNGTSQGKGTG